MLLHQSSITSYVWCPRAMKYQEEGQQRRQLSASAFGSVIHYALLEVFERQRHQDDVDLATATNAAVESFRYYWHPAHIEAICEKVPDDGWIGKQTYNSLLRKGEELIIEYANLVAHREETVLATEIGFQVPIVGTWDQDTEEPHILGGTIDRLALIKKGGNWAIEVGDIKTGKDHPYLRQNLQFTAYTYATTRPEFWTGWRGEDGFGEQGPALYEKFKDLARRGAWISTNKMSFQDAGWRGPQDWDRFAQAATELAKATKFDVFPFNISGTTCTYCEFKNICGGTGVPADDHGAPQKWEVERAAKQRKRTWK